MLSWFSISREYNSSAHLEAKKESLIGSNNRPYPAQLNVESTTTVKSMFQMGHYQQNSHKKQMMVNGVLNLIKSIPPATKPSAPSSSTTTLPENRLEVDSAEDEQKVSYKDFIVLDEVGETDDVDFEEISSSTPNGGLLDELDVVSDDDDLLSSSANNDADQENGENRTHDRDKADSDIATKADLRLPEADLISESSDDNFSVDDDDAVVTLSV